MGEDNTTTETTSNKYQNVSIETIQAEHVTLEQSSAVNIKAENVQVTDGGVMEITAQNLNLMDSVAFNVQAGTININDGGVVIARTQDINLNGKAGLIASQRANMHNSQTGVIIAGEVQAPQLNSVVVFSRQITGNVETVLDTKSAILFGAAAGLALGVVITLLKSIFRDR